ncbi:MAG: primosomal protein N' [Bacteroidetes bacterium]|nr:primosomal protein N' [Bacteroidota bacterium]
MSSTMDDMTLEEIRKLLPDSSAVNVVHGLVEKGLIRVYENLHDRYVIKKEKYIVLNPQFNTEIELKALFQKLEKAPKQLNVLLAYLHIFQQEHQVKQTNLLAQSESGVAALKALIDKQIFQVQLLDANRIPLGNADAVKWQELSAHQTEAYQHIQNHFSQQQTVLLHGLTGSGKTHVYFHLIRDVLAKGKQVLYLLPEIALTTQIIHKLRQAFGEQVGIYHSRFSNMERVELWQHIRQGKYNIVIGARSALLLPMHELGLIILDEEHDVSFKQQDPAPRYHARDAALVLARIKQASVILGSATPSLESWQNVQTGKYKLVQLTERFGEGQLPKIQLIDKKEEKTLNKYQGIFSPTLTKAIQETIQMGKQVILFQNRRGYAPLLMCQTCGWIPQCKYCDVSMTYHKQSDMMQCHYCGSRQSPVKICPDCGGNRIQAKSFGTEKVEEEIRQTFPHARVERFDWDVLKHKNKYQEIIRQFEKRQIDILVGTQMLVKGLDFEHVNLVGVLNADNLLSYPDFRVNERTFQMLAQVGGRAGRTNDQGRVLIQVYRTDHPVIQSVLRNDYAGFVQKELEERKAFLYPPLHDCSKLPSNIITNYWYKTPHRHSAKIYVNRAIFWCMVLVNPVSPVCATNTCARSWLKCRRTLRRAINSNHLSGRK